MKNLVQQQQQQFLWRPAGEVLHFLTENSTKPRLPQAPFLPNGDVPPSIETPNNVATIVRQAPTVWKPPSAMKAMIPPPIPIPPEENLQTDSLAGVNPEENFREEPNVPLTLMPPPPDKNKDSETTWQQNNHAIFNYDGNNFGQQQQNPVHCQEYIFLKQHHHHQQTQNSFLIEDNNMVGIPKAVLFQVPTTSLSNPFPSLSQNVPLPSLSQSIPSLSQSVPLPSLSQSIPSLSSPPPSLSQNVQSLSNPLPSLSKGLGFGADLSSKQPTGVAPPSLFVKQTPLFSGLGTVSFTSDSAFPAPQQPAASIFAQSPGFGAPKMSTSSSGQQQQHGNDFRSNSASEKGSSNSQAGDQSGFRRSELQGKSLLSGGEDHSPTTKITTSSKGSDAAKVTTTTTRKLRTRPMDALMNTNKTSDPKSTTEQATRSAKPKSKQPAELPPVAPRRKKQQQQQQQDVKVASQGAYFAHTGAWITQKKSMRRARNKFKQQEDENVVIYSGTRSAGKKRSLAAMNNDKPVPQPPPKKMSLSKADRKSSSEIQVPEKRSSRHDKVREEKGLRSEKRGDKGDKGREKRLVHDKNRKLDKVRSIHETMRVVASTPEDQEVDDDEDDGGDASDGEEKRGKPLIRSKRGRPQALPTRLRDTVMNKVKKKSRK